MTTESQGRINSIGSQTEYMTPEIEEEELSEADLENVAGGAGAPQLTGRSGGPKVTARLGGFGGPQVTVRR